ncbi:MAG: cache domain-containing protein [Thermodesulfobacteriota bacterium]
MSLFKAFSNLKIRYKLLLSYTLVFLIAFTLASSIIYFLVRNNIKSNIESELQNTTSTILSMVRSSASVSIRNYLRGVAEKNNDLAKRYYQMHKQGKITEKEAKKRVKDNMLAQEIGKTGYLYCIDSNGVIQVHPEEELLGEDLSSFDFIREQKRRRNGYLEYDWKNPGDEKRRPKALYMTYFEPWDWIISASSYREEFEELINVQDFRESILSVQFGETGYSFIIDSKGEFIVHPVLEGKNIDDIENEKARSHIKQICREKSGKIIYSWSNPEEKDSRKKLVIFNYIPELDWIVASSSYLEEFYSPLSSMKRIFAGTIGVFAFLILLVSFKLSSSITEPLRELMQQFSRSLEEREPVSRIRPRSNDEVGMLANYFNRFTDKLNRYSDNLKSEIRERKKAEEEIRKSEAKYRELVQNANSIILRIDTKGRITFINEFAQNFFGYSESEILGKQGIGTIMPEIDSSGSDTRKIMDKIARNPESYQYLETENMRRNGEKVMVAWTNKAIRGESGEITEFLCIGHDITEAMEAEFEMSRVRHLLRNIVDFMPSVLVGLNTEGKVNQWNQEAARITGIIPEQAYGKEVESVLPQLREHMQMINRALQEQEAQKTEKAIFNILSEERYVDIMVYPILFESIEGTVIRIDDITERVRMEEMMIQTEKMMSVGGLAAGMAHEINNPLGGILQSTQNIFRRLSEELPANQDTARELGTDLETVKKYLEQRKILQFLESINHSGQRASKIVNNMLTFSKSGESEMITLEMSELLEQTVELATHDYDLKKKYDFRNIDIIKDFEQGIPPVPCVPTEIEQVILNLLRNAAQAMHQNTTGSREPYIVLSLRQQGQKVLIEVRDNGPGMEEEVKKRVFEPFFSTKEVGVGTGLGLSVAYFIITNNHKGSMTVSSSPNRGTKFSITLPLN